MYNGLLEICNLVCKVERKETRREEKRREEKRGEEDVSIRSTDKSSAALCNSCSSSNNDRQKNEEWTKK